MLKVCVIGASGYTGVELVKLVHAHPQMQLKQVYVSERSEDAHKKIASLHPQLMGQVDLVLQPLATGQLSQVAASMDVIFLATPHQASHDWVPELAAQGAVVLDLSAAYRLSDQQLFADYYGFEHSHSSTLKEAVYGLAEYHAQALQQAQIIAVPGCYPTASLLALKPLVEQQLLDEQLRPVINAVSGVSGAGRKAALANSFCEVSLQAYGVLAHRHQPEISEQLTREVVFTPHLGPFKRGILATITLKTVAGTTAADIHAAYQQRYSESAIVRLLDHFPRLGDVVGTPHCDLHAKLDPHSGYLVVGSAIDNLLKGAASQAMQCANIRFGYPQQRGLLAGAS